MESPQMYDNVQSITQLDIKKGTMATNNINNNNHSVVNNNNNNNNNTASAINHNTMAANKTTHQMLQANNTNNNTILQKHILQQYSQSDLEELTSQEISLDLQHLIDDQFREQEALGIFSDMEPNSNNNNNNHNNNNNANGTLSAAKVLQHQNRLNQQQQSQGYQRTTLSYMPQPVHSGANYTNNSSDDNSSIGSDGTNIKEEPVDTAEFRRLAAAANGAQFIGVNTAEAGGLYQIPQNYTSNGSGNTFTTLTAPVLHHQGLPHLPGSHLASLKHKQLMSQRKHQNKHVDKGTDEYRRRRERNNIAVRKSREKAKVRSREVEEKVKALVKEKEALMRRLEEMTNEIQLHKQLYVHLMNHNNPEVNNICRNVLSLVSGDHGM